MTVLEQIKIANNVAQTQSAVNPSVYFAGKNLYKFNVAHPQIAVYKPVHYEVR